MGAKKKREREGNTPCGLCPADSFLFDRIVVADNSAGAPEDCFLWNICSEKQKLPRVFYSLRTAKKF